VQRSTVWRAAPGYFMPEFTLYDSRGQLTQSFVYRGHKSLVVVLVGAGQDQATGSFLQALCRWYPQLAMNVAEVLVILRGDVDRARTTREGERLPFPVLADPDGSLHRACSAEDAQGKMHPMAFVVDRWGEIESVYRRDGGGLPTPQELNERLAVLAVQCST
jgi:peroxiredoxin